MTSEIRLLSLWQPSASLIALGLEKYETRSWATPYRGKIAIYAAKRPVNRDELATISANSSGHLSWEIISTIIYLLNAGVAVMELTGCLGMVTAPSFAEDGDGVTCIDNQSQLEKAVGDWKLGRFAWKLEGIRPIAQPIPCKGAQQLRRIADLAVLEAIEQQLAYTAEIEQQLTAIGEGKEI
ncbi:MAG TPA: hypothetical protein V6D10_20655 [Trichocoleus sp.]|jgi:hypothetical protein